MLRIFGYIVLMLSIGIYLVSSSTQLTEKIAGGRINSTSVFSSDKYRYGDLYGMSYLPNYQIPLTKASSVPLAKCNARKKIHLYAIADSYLYGFAMEKKLYCGVDSFFHVRLNHDEKLDVNLIIENTSILLLEISERNFRTYLNNTSYINNLIKAEDNQKELKVHTKTPAVFSQINEFLFNKSINTNLELNIWDFKIFTPIKEFKANINHELFDVLDNNIMISPDNKYLLYKPTIDTTVITSSFQFIPDAKILEYVQNLNNIYKRSKSLGFKEVYLAIIPNPVSILYPDYKGLKYNQLIPRIQNSPDLKMPVVDIYSTFKNTNLQVYEQTDTHWNIDGAHMWLNKFNNILEKSNL